MQNYNKSVRKLVTLNIFTKEREEKGHVGDRKCPKLL